jgi:hypothetical protein
VRWTPAWHRQLDRELIELAFQPPEFQSYVRRVLAQDPVAFSIIYMSRHLKNPDGVISFSRVHYEWARLAQGWTGELAPQANRHAFIAPRETGKSTWWFLILPMWGACNRIIRFAVAFADTEAQATGHLTSFKNEINTNALLQADFPWLADPSGRRLADRSGMLHTSGGFVFAARGMDSAVLGLKVGEVRPDLIIFDDIEPDEKRYSQALAKKRLGTVLEAVFPLNIRARVIFVGTVTMPGSIMHQFVQVAAGIDLDDEEHTEKRWIRDEKITPHHHRALIHDDEGREASIWPDKWPLEFLLSIRHTRSYAKNYENDPMGRDGQFWTKDDFRYLTLDPPATRWLLQLDPAVTTKDKSDWTGWAVVAYRPPMKTMIRTERGFVETSAKPMVEVVAAGQIKLQGERLRAWVLKTLIKYERIKAVRVEVNQGGEMWYTVLNNLSVPLLVHTSTESKEVRFAYALDFYQRGGGYVVHREKIRVLEEQMVAFPDAPFDDVADAAVSGILYFLKDEPSIPAPTARAESYV